MALTDTQIAERFPRTEKYNPEWIKANASGGANSLWLTEWLAFAMDLQSGMRVLDLGCGCASSSIFLRREFDVQVWATDLWFHATGNWKRIQNADITEGITPIHADARSLPFAAEFFDAIIGVDSFYYFGTDALYLNYLAQFVKPGGQIGIAGAGLTREVDGEVPEHLRGWWSQDLWSLQSAQWWRRHWERTDIGSSELAETMEEGWQLWLEWMHRVAPDNKPEIETLENDHGQYLGYVRVVGRRQSDVKLEDYCWPDTLRSFPSGEIEKQPLLKETEPRP